MSNNENNPNGFTPRKFTDGSPYYGMGTRYYKDATAGIIAMGDEVIRVVSSSDPQGGAEIIRATAGAAITGVVVGFEPDYSNLRKIGYLAAADVGYVYVEDRANVLYEVMEAGSGTPLAITDVGKHIDSITAANGNTVIGRSVSALDNNAKATDNTWILVGLADGSAIGDTYRRWYVKPNLHTEVNAGATNVKEI